MTFTNLVEYLAESERVRHCNKRSHTVFHRHLWFRDDQDGFRDYICILCGNTFGIKVEATP